MLQMIFYGLLLQMPAEANPEYIAQNLAGGLLSSLEAIKQNSQSRAQTG